MTPVSPRFPDVDFAAWCAEAAGALGFSPRDDAFAHTVDRDVVVRALHVDAPRDSAPPGFPPFTRGADANPRAPRTVPRYEARSLDVLARDLSADARDGTRTFWIRSAANGPLQSVPDLRHLFDAAGAADIDLVWDAGADALPAAALLAAAAPAGAAGTLAFADPLATLAERGTLPRSLDALDREAIALAPRTVLLVSTHVYHRAGAGPAQEIAFALASGLSRLRVLLAGGLSPADAAARIGFSVSVGRELFPEIAKLRALRTAWSRVLAAHAVSAGPARLHAVASERTLTARDPWGNLLRVTGQMFAAVCGGADLITPACFDEAVRTPDALGRRLARNTPQILLEECFVGDVVDPAGGAYLVESLTDQLARASWRIFREIEGRSGLLETLRSGWAQAQLAEGWARHAADLESGRAPITGVSVFADPDEEPLPDSAAPVAAAAPPSRPRDVTAAVNLADLTEAARRGATLTDLITALARHDEGEAPVVDPLPRHRDAERFEASGAPSLARGAS